MIDNGLVLVSNTASQVQPVAGRERYRPLTKLNCEPAFDNEATVGFVTPFMFDKRRREFEQTQNHSIAD